MIDPDHPDLGPKNNQFTFVWGRLKDGRGEIIKRFAGDAFGSVNAHGHTTVCQGSLYFTGKAMSEQFVEGKWTGGEKFYWQGDLANTEFAILVGNNVFEGGYGPPYRVSKMTDGLTSGRLRYVVIDPRLGKTGSKAWKWLPNIPGTEAAIALALIQIMIEQRALQQRLPGERQQGGGYCGRRTELLQRGLAGQAGQGRQTGQADARLRTRRRRGGTREG
jgi:tetrathionate reductase subunit A